MFDGQGVVVYGKLKVKRSRLSSKMESRWRSSLSGTWFSIRVVDRVEKEPRCTKVGFKATDLLLDFSEKVS